MRVGMANAGSANANKNVAWSERWNLDPLLFQRRTDRGEAKSVHFAAACPLALRIAKRLQPERIVVYPSFTKYLPGSCFTRRFSSRRRSVEETVPLGSSAFVAMSSIDVSVSRIES